MASCPAVWAPAYSMNAAAAAAGALLSASVLRALPSRTHRYWTWVVPSLRPRCHQRSSRRSCAPCPAGPRTAAVTGSACCSHDQHCCSTGLAQASTLPLDQGGTQAEGLSPSEAVREMDSACKRRERDRERRKRKREQAAAVAVADGTALHVSGAGCCRGCRGWGCIACE